MGFKFISLPLAAERLGTTRGQLLAWVEEGRLRPVSGSGQQSAFRTADIERLATELRARDSTEGLSHASPITASGTAPPAASRHRPRDPVKLVGTRISQDSRWAEIGDEDLNVWLDSLEPVQFDRIRRVAELAGERLEKIIEMLDAVGRARK